MKVKGVLFDLIGTTVVEKDQGMISRCFKKAFEDHGVAVEDDMIRSGRGKDKKEMIESTLAKLQQAPSLTGPILKSLELHLENTLSNFRENEGVQEIFQYLKENEIRIGIGSGLPRVTFEKITAHLGWQHSQFDYIGIATEMKNGRPQPDMIFDMMAKCKLTAKDLVKVGDTIADIQEGKNAGVITVAVLTGTQPIGELSKQEPDYMIHSLTGLKEIIG
jgi:phosphonatase-like hydrolase